MKATRDILQQMVTRDLAQMMEPFSGKTLYIHGSDQDHLAGELVSATAIGRKEEDRTTFFPHGEPDDILL